MDEQRKIETIYGSEIEIKNIKGIFTITEHVAPFLTVTVELNKVNLNKLINKLQELCKSEIK
jgi:hypothetical protein